MVIKLFIGHGQSYSLFPKWVSRLLIILVPLDDDGSTKENIIIEEIIPEQIKNMNSMVYTKDECSEVGVKIVEIMTPLEEVGVKKEEYKPDIITDRDIKLMSLREHILHKEAQWRADDPFYSDLSQQWKAKMIKDEEESFLKGTGFTLVLEAAEIVAPAPEEVPQNNTIIVPTEETVQEIKNRKRREAYYRKKEKMRKERDQAIINDCM